MKKFDLAMYSYELTKDELRKELQGKTDIGSTLIEIARNDLYRDILGSSDNKSLATMIGNPYAEISSFCRNGKTYYHIACTIIEEVEYDDEGLCDGVLDYYPHGTFNQVDIDSLLINLCMKDGE